MNSYWQKRREQEEQELKLKKKSQQDFTDNETDIIEEQCNKTNEQLEELGI